MDNERNRNVSIAREKSKNKKIKKYRRIICIFIGVILVILSFAPSVIMNKYVDIHVNYKEVYEAKDFGISSEKLTLTTEDDLNIVAHEVFTPNSKAVVIFISGIHNPSVTAFFGHSKALQENGYSSILLELRAHGESEGDVICLGYKEYLDTKAVVDYIKSNNKYEDVPIVVCGASMGGAVAINSFGQITEIDGLISMSAFSSWEDVLCDTMINMGIPKAVAYIEKPFIKLYSTLKYGFDSFHIIPKNQIKKAGKRPVLIIHSTEDSQVPFSNFEKIMENAPKHVESWVRQGDLHFIMKEDCFLNPQDDTEYWDQIINFLNDNFAK